MKDFKSSFLILTVPIALNSLILPPFSFKLLLVQFFTLFFAEFARQWLWGKSSAQPNTSTQKRFFFFGVVYNNSNLERFFSSKSLNISSQTEPKKIVVFAVTYAISFLSTKYSAQFGGANPTHLFLISTVVSFLIFCKNHAQLNRLLLLNLFINSVFFLNQSQTAFVPFFVWFASHFFISFVSLKLEIQKDDTDKNIQDLFSFSDIKKSFATASILCLLFVIFNTVIPNYSKDIENELTKPGEPNKALSLGAQKAQLMKKTNISPETLATMAKLKTDAENINLTQLPMSFKSRSFANPPSTTSTPESNSEDLKYFSEQLKKDKPLTDEDLKKLNQLANNVEHEAKQWQDSVMNSTAQSHSSDDAFENYEKSVQNLNKEIQKSDLTKLTQESKDTKASEAPNQPASPQKESDLIQEYTDARNQIAKQVDQLMDQQQKQKQYKEELKILNSIDRIHQNSFKLMILAILFVVLIYVLSIKGFARPSQKKVSVTQVSLPSAVRRHLKDLYKALLKARLSPSEEVLRSYYLVELAMKEIDFPRSEDLPPQNYFETVNTKFPFLGAPVKVATQLFNRVFYGEKTPSQQEITTLRSSVKDLLRKLQVIS